MCQTEQSHTDIATIALAYGEVRQGEPILADLKADRPISNGSAVLDPPLTVQTFQAIYIAAPELFAKRLAVGSLAMLHGDETVVVPMDFLRVPLTATSGWLINSERLELFTVLGAALVLAGKLLNLKPGR